MGKIDPVHSYKILSCFDKILEIQSGKMPIPRTLEFFISNKCNHSCIGCHSKSLHKNKIAFLDIKKAKEVLDEAKEFGIKGIEISGGGEPLLHPHIVEFVKYTSSIGLKSGLLTNGTVFNKDNIEPLVKNLLFIRIALEAPEKILYKKIHGVDDFDKLMENIGNLIEIRRKTKSKVTIGAKSLLSKYNYGGVIKIAKIARLIGLDYVQFKALRRSSHGIPQEVENYVDKSIEDARRYFDEPDQSFQVLGSISKTQVLGRCFLNPLHPLIDAAGNVYLCAFFQHRTNTHNIGNVFENSFKDIWGNERHIKAFMSTDPDKCKHFDCPLQPPVPLVLEAIIKGKMHLEFI